MKPTIVNGWTVRSFIGDKSTEEFTQEELEEYFKKALDKAFLKIGYIPVKNQNLSRSGK